ncbi:VWA domain-containing protein [Candidatus Binatia bacterium]|nr:VWA domain-containing protein [Candidatus Binatia bacterium]
MGTRALWFEAHLLGERAGRQAREACERLGPAVHETILRAGDRLAAVSPAVAQAFYRRAPEVWLALGEADFLHWVDLGNEFLSGARPHREAALAFFGVPAPAVAGAGLQGLQAWCAIGRRLAETSRKLSATFFGGTAALVATTDAETLTTWVRHGLALYESVGWRGEFLAHGYFAAAPHVLPVLSDVELLPWTRLGAAIEAAQREAQFFGPLPPGLAALKPTERLVLLQFAAELAPRHPVAAATIYTSLPAALRRVPGTLRATLLHALQAAAPVAAEALAEVSPVLGALVRDLPATHRATAVGHAEAVGRGFPQGVVALLRTLPLAYEDAPADAVADWVARGLEIALYNEEAGLAYFALESRTSVQILHASSTAAAIGDVQGLLRKYVHMLSGRSVSIRSSETMRLRPPLEEFPLENEIALPLRIDVFATHERNCDLYRFLAAQLAGRRDFGTYAIQLPGESSEGLVDYLRAPEQPELLEELFLLAEGFRVAAGLARQYPGLAREQRVLMAEVLDRQATRRPPPQGVVLDCALAWLLAARPAGELPAWLESVVHTVAPCVAPLASATATANDALQIAHALAAQLAQPRQRRSDADLEAMALDRLMAEGLLDYPEGESGLPLPGSDTPGPPADEQEPGDLGEHKLALETETDGNAVQSPMSPEMLQRLIEAGVELRVTQGHGNDVDGLGLYITDLLGKLPDDQLDELRRLLGEGKRTDRPAPRRWLDRRTQGAAFYYDEWDYHIGDYRQRWCRLQEILLDGDSGEFFNQALLTHAALIPDIRRQFQKIRPEMYRVVRGLEDGEDFDLNAVVAARIERRARIAPSPKLYVARTREERDVATLFLIDMSASTDEPLQKTGPPMSGAAAERAAAGLPPRKADLGRRIIDVTKEALVIMAEALEEIGDAYAIYGFSGHGRQQVEFYLVKAFNETLSTAVRGRIGGIEPKRSTRMGTALRHATEKLSTISARSRHIILLSDGFPQDFDYGQDRRSNVYGIRDTTVALRECEAAGIVPFCITVDKAGHDYLREMCEESRYMVIEDTAALPRELPKIYQRVVAPGR